MLRHVVMWKFLDSAEGKTKEENLDFVKSSLEGLAGKIPTLRSVRVEKDVTGGGRNFDMMLMAGFDSPEDLQNYIVHPDHKKVSSYVAKVASARGAVDYYD